MLEFGLAGLSRGLGFAPVLVDRGHDGRRGINGVPVGQPRQLAGHLLGVLAQEALGDGSVDPEFEQVVQEVQPHGRVRVRVGGRRHARRGHTGRGANLDASAQQVTQAVHLAMRARGGARRKNSTARRGGRAVDRGTGFWLYRRCRRLFRSRVRDIPRGGPRGVLPCF